MCIEIIWKMIISINVFNKIVLIDEIFFISKMKMIKLALILFNRIESSKRCKICHWSILFVNLINALKSIKKILNFVSSYWKFVIVLKINEFEFTKMIVLFFMIMRCLKNLFVNILIIIIISKFCNWLIEMKNTTNFVKFDFCVVFEMMLIASIKIFSKYWIIFSFSSLMLLHWVMYCCNLRL